MEFRSFRQGDLAEVRQLIFQLYQQDPEGKPITGEKIDKTIRELSERPEKGRIMVFTTTTEIVGYAIVIDYWSNELGGDVLHIDELFVKKGWRRRGIATRFIDQLSNDDAVALQLEVTPSNEAALSCYKRLGFKPSKNLHLLKRS